MFTIIHNKKQKKLRPLNMLVTPRVAFCPGQIVYTKTLDDTIVCDIANSRVNSIGVVDRYLYVDSDVIDYTELLDVWCGRCKFFTDICDGDIFDYQAGDALYVNDYGLLTKIVPFENANYVGRVLSSASRESVFLEALWL